MKMGSLHRVFPAFIPASLRRWKGRRESLIATAGNFSHASKTQTTVHAKAHDNALFNEANRSIIRLVELLIEGAHISRASDIHLDPRLDFLYIRLRIDGVLQDAHTLPLSIHYEVISRIKILSGLRIDEHQTAQDGRFRLLLKFDAPVDVRVSIVPTYYGENAVLRLLAEAAEEFSLSSLGFTVHNKGLIDRAMKKPYGMILATGPTGSGKTTTMYTLVKLLSDPGVSIVTLEDPIEYSMSGITQIQINPKTDLTFGNGLRGVLRQDPDIIMVGEIRDKETAGLAVNTALTGHRILSTLHTNDAATTVSRLLDMGIEPYLIASTVSIAVGQRLVRRICKSCKIPYTLSNAEVTSLSSLVSDELLTHGSGFFKGAGCDRCAGSGFYGRAGIHEVMEVGNAVREAILSKSPAVKIRTVAIQEGMLPILIDGFRKAAQGVTTVEEILKTNYE
jgi:general secretion pathway protein E